MKTTTFCMLISEIIVTKVKSENLIYKENINHAIFKKISQFFAVKTNFIVISSFFSILKNQCIAIFMHHNKLDIEKVISANISNHNISYFADDELSSSFDIEINKFQSLLSIRLLN